ncbi:Coiled-coil domain-containing protein 25 [Phlyctochytrium planicorne]|nr:Coiled-coil domain-containing protein 25 [Phlyctochytrium planicorne]
MSWDNIPEELLQDIAQLTKANSIEGNKKNNITVIYTPWSNLKKTTGMETGQVSFHKSNLVKKVFVEKRVNEIVNRLNKTKVETYPDLMAERVARNREDKMEQRQYEKKKKQEELERANEKKRNQDLKNYKGVFDEENMRSNKYYLENGGDFDDDFM